MECDGSWVATSKEPDTVDWMPMWHSRPGVRIPPTPPNRYLTLSPDGVVSETSPHQGSYDDQPHARRRRYPSLWEVREYLVHRETHIRQQGCVRCSRAASRQEAEVQRLWDL